jgi:menaquinone-dependent protoporphyrinogen IX oxidase
MMKRIAAKDGLPTDTSEDHELTDWDQVRRVALSLMARAPVSGGN